MIEKYAIAFSLHFRFAVSVLLLSPPGAGGYEMAAQFSPLKMLWYNANSINPAGWVRGEVWSMHLGSRRQWPGLQGAPGTFDLGLRGPVSERGNIGVLLRHESIGLEQRSFISGQYAYTYPLSFARLTFGVGGGVSIWSIDGAAIRTPSGDYTGGVAHRDAILPESRVSLFDANLAVGLSVESPLGLIGMYFENSNVTGWNLSNGGEYAPFSAYQLYWSRPFALYRDIRLVPFGRLYGDKTASEIELGAKWEYQDNITLNASLRIYSWSVFEGIGLGGGFKWRRNWTIYYMYNVDLGIGRSYWSGTGNEISLVYTWGKRRRRQQPPVIYNPIYL